MKIRPDQLQRAAAATGFQASPLEEDQLGRLLTRQQDIELFAGARLDFLVFDEAHTFTGARGAETACLVRRLRSFCGWGAGDSVCVATSATIVDRENPDAARDFASRFFGVERDDVVIVGEAYEPGRTPPAPSPPCSRIRGGNPRRAVVAGSGDRHDDSGCDLPRRLSRG